MLRGIWLAGVVTVLTVALAIPAILVTLARPSSDITVRLGKVWCRAILGAAGARPVYHGLESLTTSLPCIYVCNHLSLLDAAVLAPVLPDATRFAAKRLLFRIPVFGWALRAAGFVPIDRRDRLRANESLARAAETIRAGRPIVMFPEGTRSRDGALAPFKRGAFRLAVEAGVPLVPIAVFGTDRVLRRGTIRVRPGSVQVRVRPAIVPEALRRADVDGLSDAVRREIEAALDECRGAPGTVPPIPS
jgi:1-acyl-sn-glycerol-3-phosphate acyltransferase